MKNKLCIFAAAALMLAACSKGSDETVVRSLKVTPQSVTFAADETSPRQLTVTTENTDWKFDASSAAWLSATRQDNTLNISCTENTDANAREAKITISATESGVLPVSISVKQQGLVAEVVDPVLKASETSVKFPATGVSPKEITITTDGGVTWDANANDDWVSVSTSGDILTISVEENENSLARSCNVFVFNTNNDLKDVNPISISVAQDALEVEASLNIINLPEGGIIEFTHYENHHCDKNYSGTLTVDIQPKWATCSVEVVDSDGWLSSSGENIPDGSMIPLGTRDDVLPEREGWAKVIVRHDQNPDVFVEIIGHKSPMIYFDSESTITGDIECNNMTNAFGQLQILKGIYYTGHSIVNLAFYTDGVDYEFGRTLDRESNIQYQYSGKGEIVSFLFYDVDLPENDDISNSTFTIGEGKEPGTATEGSQSLWGGRYQLAGCFYTSIDNDITKDVEYAFMKSGDITVSKSGDDYTIEWKTFTDNGHSISGKYTGPIDLQVVVKDITWGGGNVDDDQFGQK